MKKAPVFENEQSERAFRTWQERNYLNLITAWKCHHDQNISYDAFCLGKYTGHIK